MAEVIVIGGGLAGSEAAWQASLWGLSVTLYEMRPQVMTPAHRTRWLAELVCSNSLGSNLVDRAPGLLKEELRKLGSMVLACADATAVPAGSALAVAREDFAQQVTQRIAGNPRITLKQQEAVELLEDIPTVVATGPLTSPSLAQALAHLIGEEYLYFYDAVAPIVAAESIDREATFTASRYGRGGADYINCPMDRDQYYRFVDALLAAATIPLRDFEREDKRFFEACLPIEVLARRGQEALAYGPLRPVGLVDPRTGERPYAVVQLRQDDAAGELYNLVGFQTNLRWGEQERVLHLIPGLENAEFVRFGMMHRNTFINSPRLLEPSLQARFRGNLFFAGQITGMEGYVAAIAGGLLAGINAACLAAGHQLVTFPPETMLGALARYVTTASPEDFQPMKPNFGLLPPLPDAKLRRRERRRAYAERALAKLEELTADWE